MRLVWNFNSYQRENSIINKWKFQGQEHVTDLDLGWDSFKWRNHMPDIGRFFNVDPLADKYVYNSPYAFCENKVISFVELEGLEAATPLPPGDRMRHFAANHPIAALGIGKPSKGSSNISTNAVRFSTRGASSDAKSSVLAEPASMGNEGTEVNAMRHTLWQAAITTIFGSDIATEIGNAHERNPNAIDDGLIEGASFENRQLADEAVDLANNVIGRDLGSENSSMGMKDLAIKVLDTFAKDGLWTATKQENGSYSVSRTKITSDQYETLKSVYEKLDNNGRTDKERQEYLSKHKIDPNR